MKLVQLSKNCPLCKLSHDNESLVCNRCTSYFDSIEIACIKCRSLVTQQALCGRCQNNPPSYDNVHCHYYYTQPVKQLLHQFKFNQCLYLSHFLTKLMLETSKAPPLPQCFIPIPLHPSRLKMRGFNQAVELSKILSKKLKIPYSTRLCHKRLATLPQSQLTATDRSQNLKHAFESASIPYQHIALVDDILTTGSTVNALSCAIKKINPGIIIDVWCPVRTH